MKPTILKAFFNYLCFSRWPIYVYDIKRELLDFRFLDPGFGCVLPFSLISILIFGAIYILIIWPLSFVFPSIQNLVYLLDSNGNITRLLGLDINPNVDLNNALVVSIRVGLLWGLLYFLFADLNIFKNPMSRFVLSVTGTIPFRLTKFLNYAVDRIFLRKVGQSYIFIHNLLLNHFAQIVSSEDVPK